ncbi:uracil-DNA glycosylase family protein [Sphingomonas sp.]|uniref:uracil-DNA glycosylase family protein n=1 Tax=Sphingomonas sp. TaxID=28214 RepID=UPI002EDA660D
MPATLAAFVEWRGGVDMPEAAWAGASIAASGPDIADLMILADCPDRDDEGTLLSGGAPGRLFGRMLAAVGLTRDDVHIAAICWRRPTAGRIPREIEARLGDMARHHIGLVAPRRLLLLGDGAVRAVLGTHLAEARGRLHFVNHIGGRVAVVASHHPRFLIEKPACKAESWSDLRMLMRDHAEVEGADVAGAGVKTTGE